MIDLKFANEKIEKRIMTYIEAFRNAGISGTFHFPGRILSKEDWVPCVVVNAGVFFTPHRDESMHACYDVADSLPISMMAGLHLMSYHDFYEGDPYAKYSEGEWTIDI